MRWIVCSLALALSACASSNGSKGVTDAATTPLSDLNLVKAEIPPVLAAALKAPYQAPASPGCEAIAAEVTQLEAVLGAGGPRCLGPTEWRLRSRSSAAARIASDSAD